MDTMQAQILIVEDESIIALDIKRIVEKSGYKVTSIVNRVSDALKIIEIEKPDLILMDIQLDGERSGIEGAEIIYNKYAIPFIYLTALTDNDTMQKAKKIEPSGYVFKPFDEEILITTIEMALNTHSGESGLIKKTSEPEKGKLKNGNLFSNILPKIIFNELKIRGNFSPCCYRT